tara:strand:- start:17699 stop:18784 length:1086 start_codon:yes stop_codon:yes gene_type:complete
MSSLLEEAIVDAKALKEAALKNAENTVLEKYSGEVKRALDTILEQEEGSSADTDNEELMEFTKDVPLAFENEAIDGPAADEIIEIDFDALKQRLEEEDEVIEGEDLLDATEMADEIALQEDDDLEQMEKDEDVAEKSTAVASSGGGSAGMPLEEDENIDLTEEMISDLIEELVVDMKAVPQGWASVNSADNSVEQANNDAMAAAQAAHLEEDEEEEAQISTASDVVSDVGLFETKISEITKSNRELRALIMEAKNQLTRLNLANAKLVYQNKALNSASLNERQKNQIAEAVQSANSVEEAQMIFETIQNAVGATNSNSSRPQTLREAVQRPTSLLINSKRNNEATVDPNMGRMLRLAGLNK